MPVACFLSVALVVPNAVHKSAARNIWSMDSAMMEEILLEVSLILILILVNGFFAAAEISGFRPAGAVYRRWRVQTTAAYGACWPCDKTVSMPAGRKRLWIPQPANRGCKE